MKLEYNNIKSTYLDNMLLHYIYSHVIVPILIDLERSLSTTVTVTRMSVSLGQGDDGICSTWLQVSFKQENCVTLAM